MSGGTVHVRPATPEDAEAMCAVINPIVAAGGTTAHRNRFDPARMVGHYIAPPLNVSCVVAEEAGRIIGFQGLEWADPDYEGEPVLPADWATIGSFVARGIQARGVGQALFAATEAAARQAGVAVIDATILKVNEPGLRYYARLGFVDYRVTDLKISKRYDLESVASGAPKP